MASPRAIEFMLNGKMISLSPDRADITLLNWLREDAKLTGSKEGCAEGDCGACSVVVARVNADGAVDRYAANACILFLPMLDGCSVTTVEHVEGPDGELHPVQAAMVNHHGSQCGFCTPGFILSLVAGWRSGQLWDRASIETLIAGNLCRCTGYGPIITAAESLATAAMPDWEKSQIADEDAWLHALVVPPLQTADHGQIFTAPETLDDLSQAIAQDTDAQIIAGATDIGLWVTKKHLDLPRFISVMRVKELQQIDESDACFTIGAGVSHAEAQAAMKAHFPQLDELWRRFGSSQVRASGTVCGNIANGSPIGDLAPAFLALGASVTLRQDATERDLPLDEFFLNYMENAMAKGEWLKSITITKLNPDQRFHAIKISRRFDQDISAVMGAFCFNFDGDKITQARIGFGGMAAIPARAKKCEAALIGHDVKTPLSDDIINAMQADFTPIDDVRASADYRQKVALNLLIKALSDDAVMLAGGGIDGLDLGLDSKGVMS